MKKISFALPVIAGLSLGAFAADDQLNMPTFADGHNKDMPAAEFTYKPASKHTAKANREACRTKIRWHLRSRLEA